REAAQRKLEAEQAKAEAAEAARRAREAAAAERHRADMRPAREGFIEVISQRMATAGFGINFEFGSPDTTIRVVGPCSRALLEKLVELVGQNMRNVAFQRIECGSSAAIGLDL